VQNHPGVFDYIIAAKAPPVVAELEAVFSQLPDEDLIAQLRGPTRRGPKGHPVETLWRCFVTKYVLGLESTAALIRTLHNNPFIAQACGLNSSDTIPHESTFSRFFAKLSQFRMAARLKDVSRSLVRRCYAEIPAFGDRVALDSSTLKAWSNAGKTPKADPRAGWSVKKGTQGTKEFTYGWKLHLLVDCETELPVAANVSAGNVHDAERASNVLREARFTYKNFGSNSTAPRFVLADQGYSGKELFSLIRWQYKAEPIIQVNKSHKRLASREVQWSPEWTALYKQRQAVERAFSRLKGQRSLNHIRVRGLRKVTAHCYLSVIALQVVNLGKVNTTPVSPQMIEKGLECSSINTSYDKRGWRSYRELQPPHCSKNS